MHQEKNRKTPSELIAEEDCRREMERQRQQHRKHCMILFFIGGLAIWGFGIYVYFLESRVYSRWTPTTARVLEVKNFQETTLRGPHDYYTIKITYEAGQQTQTLSKNLSGTPKSVPGEMIPITYNPEDSQQWRFDSGSTSALYATLVVCGGFLILLGTILHWYKPKPLSQRKAIVSAMVVMGLVVYLIPKTPFNLALLTLMAFVFAIPLSKLALNTFRNWRARERKPAPMIQRRHNVDQGKN